MEMTSAPKLSLGIGRGHLTSEMIIEAILFPTQGFLGTGAPFSADLNLVVQIGMGGALGAGAYLAKQGRYKAHGVCQATIMLLNVVMVALIMGPSFEQQLRPALSRGIHKWYYEVGIIHAAMGTMTETLGLYIVTVAGTQILPSWLRFKNWKRWMRTQLILWFIVLITGLGTYCAWYVAPFR